VQDVAIALGSNLGDRAAHLTLALSALRALLAGLIASPFIETEPVGVGPQPRFLNAAAVGRYGGTAASLLDALLSVERHAGRQRPHAGAARTLDLDLILFGDAVIDAPGLVVPHPRFRERAFVLGPLTAIAPGMRDPVSGMTVAELAHALKEQRPCA
jgi:2-amino-4-hydroxy-6-hydroxymethyldihydropteridine diphosphokinase